MAVPRFILQLNPLDLPSVPEVYQDEAEPPAKAFAGGSASPSLTRADG